MRSRLLLATTVLLVTACTSTPAPRPPQPKQITPAAPTPGPQENCKARRFGKNEACVAWTAPEPRRFSEIVGLHGVDSGTGATWDSYYACDAVKDDVAEAVLGSRDFVRIVVNRFICQIMVPGYEKSGMYNSLEIYLVPADPNVPDLNWFHSQSPLGALTSVNGRRAIRSRDVVNSVLEKIEYIVETSNHTVAWNIDLQRTQLDYKVPFTPSEEDVDRRAHLVIDALMAYDVT